MYVRESQTCALTHLPVETLGRDGERPLSIVEFKRPEEPRLRQTRISRLCVEIAWRRGASSEPQGFDEHIVLAVVACCRASAPSPSGGDSAGIVAPSRPSCRYEKAPDNVPSPGPLKNGSGGTGCSVTVMPGRTEFARGRRRVRRWRKRVQKGAASRVKAAV